MSADSGIKTLDMYGQSIKLSYNKSNFLSSICGGIVSLMVAILVIVYTFLFIFDTLKLDKPKVLFKVENFFTPPKFYLIPDLIGYFDEESAFYNLTKEETVDTSIIQIAFGLQDTNTLELLPFDPSYFYLNITYISENADNPDTKSIQLFFDYCKRFPFISQSTFYMYKLNKTYCVYSPFILHGNENNGYNKVFSMSLQKCRNNTITEVKKESLNEYNRLKYVYNQMRERKFVDSKIFFESNPELNEINLFNDESYKQKKNNITEPLININTNLKNLQDINERYDQDVNSSWANPYIKLIDSSDNSSPSIICKSDNDITNRVMNTRIVFYYLQDNFNTTNFKQTISTQLSQKMMYHTAMIKKQIKMYLQKDKIISYNSILPPSMLNQSVIDYFIHESDFSQYLYGDPSFDIFFKFKIESATLRLIYERKYLNALDIMGILGGLSRIFIIAGFCLVFYYACIKKREKFINETYNVIEPRNLDKITRSFTDFIKEITQNKEIYEKTKFKDQTFLEEYFCERLNEITDLIQKNDKNVIKYQILYEVFKQEAYSGFSYNYFEIFLNMFCCCFLTKKLKHKNLTFMRACKELEKDNDFRSIFKAIKDFESLKRCFLDEGQYNLLNAVANPEITWRSVRNKMKAKKELTIKSMREMKHPEYLVRTNGKNFEKIVGLEIALDEILNKTEKNQTDLALLDSLINNEELIQSFNKIVKVESKSDTEKKEFLSEEYEDRNVQEIVELDENDLKQMIDIFN